MRVEIHSPDGLKAAYQGTMDGLRKDEDGFYYLATVDGFAVVLLKEYEVKRLMSEPVKAK